ncbi:hypothetical protein CYMTET_11959 [Cymbomonas tetramitiformis]|uniref:PHD-type domain-containing protein n=1 Tax=Cymbomonas tetramitiformis TaxID=36881 RepID=A0AAE0GLD4_9CHLO|nr:hypothetical protein CYMTET_11959 [Cymbomonas tetramitiformis]
MYRWSLDLLKPDKVTPSGHRRILVMTEHYTRFCGRAVPMPDKEARRVNSPDSPEGNGLTERVACTIKFCLKKCALVHGLNFEWDQFLWAIVLSYNAAKQQSTGVAPFTMLFAQEPTVPPDLKGRPALEFDTMPEGYADTRVVDLLARAEVVKRQMIHAGCNLEVAHHRDQRRYQQHRSSAYVPKPHRFAAGDFVYAKSRRPKCGLEAATKPAILKVVEIKDTGVVTLEDRTGLKEKTTASHIAPCFLMQIKDKYDFQEAVPGKYHACHVCKRSDNDSKMLLCDRCNKGYHLWCLQPTLKKAPDGEWHGPCCEDKPEAARAERRRSEEADAIASQRNHFVGLGTGAGDDGAG